MLEQSERSLDQHVDVVVDVFEHVEHDDRVEPLRSVGELAQIGVAHRTFGESLNRSRSSLTHHGDRSIASDLRRGA